MEGHMSNVTALNLRSMSYDQLLHLFVNAVGLIVKEKQIDRAKETIIAIQEEWARRRALGDAFVDFDRPELGMLGALGYRVGQTDGRTPSVRKEIVRYVLDGELPMVHSASYTEEWGEPGSAKRYSKLVRFLQNKIENNRNNPSMKVAVSQWSEDLAWIEHYHSQNSSRE
jgi:hypothetical protein